MKLQDETGWRLPKGLRFCCQALLKPPQIQEQQYPAAAEALRGLGS